MVKQPRQYGSAPLDVDGFDEATTDHQVPPYELRESAPSDRYPDDFVPLFRSDYHGEPDPSEYINPLRSRQRASLSSRILAGVCAAAAAAILVALFSSDAAQDIVVNVKASMAPLFPASSAAAQPDPSQLVARPLKYSARLSEPETQPPGVGNVRTAAVAPTREAATLVPTREVTRDFPPSPLSGPPAPSLEESMHAVDAIHRLDPSEIASSLRRAEALIASGDLAAARLVLHRAADAGDANAAMRLAGTYDPVLLSKLGVHGFVPDIAMARRWYEKAKTFGAVEATQRLEVLANKQH